MCDDYFDETIKIGSDETRAKILEDITMRHEGCVYASKFQAVIEGKCHNCGSNRLEYGKKEPDGVSYISCPVCGKEAFDMGPGEWDYDIGT